MRKYRQKKIFPWLVVVLACLLLSPLVLVIFGQRVTKAQADTLPAPVPVTLNILREVFKNAAITFGDPNGNLLIVEVSNPVCSFCQIVGGINPKANRIADQFTLVADGGSYIAPEPEIKALVDSGKAAFAYIYHPGGSTNGELGMKALYCASAQGKFWEVHDLLAAGHTTTLDDMPEFVKPCITSGKYDEQLKKDMVLAQRLGVDGAPWFFVNTTSFPGSYSWTDMQPEVEAGMK